MWLKDFLYDRTIYATAALLVLALVWAVYQWRKAVYERIEDLKLIAPLADRLADQNEELAGLMEKVVSALRARSGRRASDSNP